MFLQIGLNNAPCSGNCKFCSLAASHYGLAEEVEKSEEEILAIAGEAAHKIDALFLMTTADYPVERFLEIGRKVKALLPENVLLIANIGDFGQETAKKLKEAGFTGVYHIVRLNEGVDTELSSEIRIATLDAIASAGLDLIYCVEPIGPEHTYDQIAEEILRARHYHVDRMSYDSFLLIYVKSGEGYAEAQGSYYPLQAGDILLLDCYIPHKYGTNTAWEIQWLHFDGPMARSYFERIQKNGQLLCIASHHPATHDLRKMLRQFASKAPLSDIVLSKQITDLLTSIILYGDNARVSHSSTIIDECVRYISSNLDKELSVEQLSQEFSLSPYYFSRLFKEETGVSPHKYLVMVRLDYARYVLRSTNLTIKETAYRCGFNSESNFCTCFREAFGITPKEYRQSY